MKAVMIAGMAAAITINYFTLQSNNSLPTEKLFNEVRGEIAVLDIPHDPFMMMSLNRAADLSSEQASEPLALYALQKDAIAIDYVCELSDCAGYEVLEEKYLREEITVYTSTCGGCCTGYIIETLEAGPIEVIYKTAEPEVAELILEEEVKIDYSVNAYPNPFTDNATIDIENYDGEPYTFVLYDLSGKMLDLRQNVTENRIQIGGDDLAAGIYVWKLITNSESQVKSGKLIAQ